LLSFCFFGTENMFARSVYKTTWKQFQYTQRICMVATSYHTQITLHWVSEWASIREGIAGRTYQCCHTARPNDARFSTWLLHVQHYTMYKIRYKTCRNKMLICSCGVPPKSCSRVTRFAIPGINDGSEWTPRMQQKVGRKEFQWSWYDSVGKMLMRTVYLRISQRNVVVDHGWGITMRIRDTATQWWRHWLVSRVSSTLITRQRCWLYKRRKMPKSFLFCGTVFTSWRNCLDFLFTIIYTHTSRQRLCCGSYNWVMCRMRFCNVRWAGESITSIWHLEKNGNISDN
jgi:hypothetical protein